MRKYIRIFSLIAALPMLLLVGCEEAGVSEPDPINIDNVSWIFENISPNFWSSRGVSSTAMVAFTVELDTRITTLSDIERVRFDAQGLSWVFEGADVVRDIDLLERSGGRQVLDFPLLFVGASPHAIPLTGWEVTVSLTNGRTGSTTVNFAPPNSTNENLSLTHVHSEDYSGSTANRVEMVNRAAVDTDTATFDGTTIEINFTVDDTDVKNGWVRVYDELDNVIGSSNTFAGWDAAQTVDTNIIDALNVDGLVNTVSIEASDFEVSNSSGLTFADARRIVVMLTDGEQWTEDFFFDFRSRSDRVTLTTPTTP